jgi:hypothetical protein
VSGLAYFGMVTGEIIAFVVIVSTNPRYVKKLEANNNIPVPEWRLPISMVGGVLFTGGLFWFGWSGYSGNVHWIGMYLRPSSQNCLTNLQSPSCLVSSPASASSQYS